MTFDEHKGHIEERRQQRAQEGLEPLPLLYASFSGGRTSAVMTKRIWDEWRDQYDVFIVFANTGCEDNATLDFVHQCEVEFDWPVAWIEAKVDPEKGKGVRHTVTDYYNASRNGEPFELVIAKYGIFNPTNKSCTSRLKVDPMCSFLREHGFKWGKQLNHKCAIGIRSDEIDRASPYAMRTYGAIYPMIDWEMTKRKVGLEIATWGFDLRIKGDHYGNCSWCWKKSRRKLLTLAKESPELFDFPERMEEKYGDARPESKSADENGRCWFFRDNMSVAQLKEMAATTRFRPYRDNAYEHGWDADLDKGGGCGESCEVFSDENWQNVELPFMEEL